MQVAIEVVDVNGVGMNDKTPFVYIGRYDKGGNQVGSISRCIEGARELKQLLLWMRQGECFDETFDAVLVQLAPLIQGVELADVIVPAWRVSISRSEKPASGVKSCSLRWTRSVNKKTLVVYRGYGHDTDPCIAFCQAFSRLLQNISGGSHVHS
ncbi:hypothetical protein COT78_00330 [Candidatus Berkelbacteria bacterium CG10_big_fil_rev_8_21_14_0_10_43_13]|uniref:Uncharacterized protein n=1 Tax=Candidatus Berkelbacteria bacterium CG10_big_fil_rev_8_21_14_0_10_43_13 TaxID=1974514 RepID=A0A2H0W7L1_9BACT|nr:MAG: hypothetical protein COT78_00330 [Candidatus Berkelbacteria bacterium CG10_big_fil_rev_8_21_14_0_10_43_13]